MEIFNIFLNITEIKSQYLIHKILIFSIEVMIIMCVVNIYVLIIDHFLFQFS